MADKFLITSSGQSLFALSVILKTEGISFIDREALQERGAALIDIEELDEDFHPSSDSSLFVSLSPNQALEWVGRLSKAGFFRVSCKRIVSAHKGLLSFREGDIFQEVRASLEASGFSKVLIPLDNMVELEVGPGNEIVAVIEVNGINYPAIIAADGHFLLSFDLGGSLCRLLTETYPEHRHEDSPHSWFTRFAHKMAPYFLRLLVYRNLLRYAQKRLRKAPGFRTVAPVDPAGWTLCQVLVGALEHSADFLPRIWKWPHNHRYAFCFTHDIEPRRYAYYRGMPDLLDVLRELDLKSTVFVVAEPPFPLPADKIRDFAEEGHEILSHGFHHDGAFSSISESERAAQIGESQKKLEQITGIAVKGFRAPLLQRTTDLGKILQGQGILFDSSLVDSDTSLKRGWYGRGISFNFPFWLFSAEGTIEEHMVLELPLTGPQDMEPFFAGQSLESCKQLFKQKHEWIKSIGGLYVFLAHAGVFGDRDSEARMELLRYLHGLVVEEDVWLAKLGEVSRWWRQRQGLRVVSRKADEPSAISFEVENRGQDAVMNFSVAIPSKHRLRSAPFCSKTGTPLEKGEYTLIPIARLEAKEKLEIALSFDVG